MGFSLYGWNPQIAVRSVFETLLAAFWVIEEGGVSTDTLPSSNISVELFGWVLYNTQPKFVHVKRARFRVHFSPVTVLNYTVTGLIMCKHFLKQLSKLFQEIFQRLCCAQWAQHSLCFKMTVAKVFEAGVYTPASQICLQILEEVSDGCAFKLSWQKLFWNAYGLISRTHLSLRFRSEKQEKYMYLRISSNTVKIRSENK